MTPLSMKGKLATTDDQFATTFGEHIKYEMKNLSVKLRCHGGQVTWLLRQH